MCLSGLVLLSSSPCLQHLSAGQLLVQCGGHCRENVASLILLLVQKLSCCMAMDKLIFHATLGGHIAKASITLERY